MSNLKNYFEKWRLKYEAKRGKFQDIVSSWANKRSKDSYNHGLALISKADALLVELSEAFSRTSNESKLEAYKSKVNSFKKTYKELNEYTKPIWQQWLEAIIFAGVAVIILRNFLFGLYHVPTGSAEPTLLVGDRVWGNKLAYRLGSKPQRGDYIICDNPLFLYDKSNPINYWWQKYVGFAIPLLGLSAGPDNWTKRVIAVPGDVIEGRVENGRTNVYLNGKLLDEPYVNPYPLICLEKKTGLIDLDSLGPIPIPDFLRVKHKPVFYTYDPDKDFNNQPFYNMGPEEIQYKPGTINRWLKMAYEPSKGIGGKSIDNFGPFTVPQGKYWVMGDSRRNSADSRVWGFLDEKLIHGRASFIIYSIDSEEPFWLLELIKHPIDFWKKSIRWDRFFKGISNDNRKKIK